MYPQPKKSVAPLVLGILSLIFSVLFAIIGLILGIIGLSLGISKNKGQEFDYKIPIILNSLGIGIAAVNMIIGFIQGYMNAR
ncbi:hypothetical protein ACVR1G_08075 [Streptococcus dentasini]